jgi:predicted metalloprotease with PDZ domain
MSLAESSFDTWLKNDTNRSHNSSVSIYLKGSLVTWLFDKEIRERTDNRKSMDDLSLLLFQQFGQSQKGYNSSDVKQLLKKITNTDFTVFWQDYVEGTKEIDFKELLAFYGLQFESDDDPKKRKATLGFISENKNGNLSITQLDADGPAWDAGLSAGDTLIAINGYQVNDKNLEKHIENLTIGQTYSLHYFHQGILKQTQITPTIAAPENLKLVPIKKPDYKQRQHFKGWTQHSIEDAFKENK